MRTVKLNIWTIVAAIYIAFWAGIAYNSIGSLSKPTMFTWTIVPGILVLLGVPFLLGYYGGKK